MKDAAEERGAGQAGPAKQFFRNLLDLRGDMMPYGEINTMMEENTSIHGSNMWILMLAILIASIGLNVNSTAVIVGAMLISPLMSGILTMGYSLAVGDLKMLRRALASFGVQVAISLIASSVYFWISPLDQATSEMIARTSPTIWDVLIALFGGCAGMIGNTRRKKGNVIPGVAIATALMPPLCTAGYGLANLQPRFFFGAFYLFFINTLFIALSSALVTALLRVPRHRQMDPRRQKRINCTVAVITVITVVPSILIGAYTVYNSYMERNVDAYLRSAFSFSDSQVVKSSFDTGEKTISVSLVGTPVSDETLGLLEKELDRYDLAGYTLHVTQNTLPVLEEIDDTDKITIAVQENTIAGLRQQIEEQQARLDELEKSVASKIDFNLLADRAGRIFSDLKNCRCGVIADSSIEYVILAADVYREFSASETESIENWLRSESGHVMVRLILTPENEGEPSEEETGGESGDADSGTDESSRPDESSGS